MAIWAELDHANILPFYGYVVENEYPSLVSEWMDNGTIKSYLQTNKCDLMQLVLHIIFGEHYIELTFYYLGSWNSEGYRVSS